MRGSAGHLFHYHFFELSIAEPEFLSPSTPWPDHLLILGPIIRNQAIKSLC